jgi:hypothetical protein
MTERELSGAAARRLAIIRHVEEVTGIRVSNGDTTLVDGVIGDSVPRWAGDP